MSESTERKRRCFSDEHKAAIVRRHLNDKVPVSDLVDEHQIQPSWIYLWVKQVLDQAERAFRQPDGTRRRLARDPKDPRATRSEAGGSSRASTTKLSCPASGCRMINGWLPRLTS